jgi:hypothetical protein
MMIAMRQSIKITFSIFLDLAKRERGVGEGGTSGS